MSDTVKDSAAFLDAQMTEKQWLAQVKAAAKAAGWLVYHNFDARRSDPGFPDLVMVRSGATSGHERVIFAELKTEKGKVRPEQWEWIDALRDAEQPTYVWRPSDWSSIEKVLA